MISVIEHTRSHVAQWMRATKLMRMARLGGLRAEVQPSPLGVVESSVPGTFRSTSSSSRPRPRSLPQSVMIKMSEITSNTADLMKATAPRYFDQANSTSSPAARTWRPFSPDCRSIICSSPARRRWVHWCSGRAQNLVPVTLELGGKNPSSLGPAPTFVDRRRGSRRAAWSTAGRSASARLRVRA